MRQDLVYALRMIARTPVVTLIAVVSLALALAANTTIFAIVNSWLIRPSPYADGERLVHVWETRPDFADDEWMPTSPATFFDWQERTDSFEALQPLDYRSANLTGLEEPEQLLTARTTPELLEMLGAQTVLGRRFAAGEGTFKASGATSRPLLLRETFWRDRFGRDAAVLGTELMLDGEAHTVVGVLSDQFELWNAGVDVWIATDFADQRDVRDTQDIVAVGKLAVGVTAEQARQEVSAITADIDRENPELGLGERAVVIGFDEQFPSPTDRLLVNTLLLVVTLVLLVACFNVAGLYLAKTDARRSELAVREALGAGRARLLRHLLTESVLLALMAGALGLALGSWAIAGLASSLDQIPRPYLPQVDFNVVLHALALSALAGVAFGAPSTLQAVRRRARSPLLDGTRGGTSSRSRKRVRAALVVTQFALALAILVGAAVLGDAVERRLDKDAGFESDGLLAASITLSQHRYPDAVAMRQFEVLLAEELDRLAGADSWALTSTLPRANSWPVTSFALERRPPEVGREPWSAWSAITPSMMETLRLQMKEGRAFDSGDLHAFDDSAAEARGPAIGSIIVNERFVQEFADLFDEAGVVGERIQAHGQTWEIVGVVAEFAQSRMHGLEPARSWIYLPYDQYPTRGFQVVVRAAGSSTASADPREIDALAASLAPALRRLVWSIDETQPVSDVQTVNAHIEHTLAGPQFIVRLLAGVGALALALAAMGIYGLTSFTVALQTREIGLRMAIGAQSSQVIRQFARSGLQLSLAGLLLGVPLAFVVMRLFDTALDGLGSAISFLPLVAVASVLGAVGLVASYIPARHATRIDPLAALQQE